MVSSKCWQSGALLWGNPDLLLVDEPTEGLAPIMLQEVRNVLAKINNVGVSILLVEHNLKVAISLAQRIYIMGKAHIGFEGTVQELDSRPDMRNKYLEVSDSGSEFNTSLCFDPFIKRVFDFLHFSY